MESDFDIAAVISVSGINSAMDGIVGKAKEFVGPVIYGNYGFLWLYQTMRFGGDIANRNAAEAINESGVPVLIVHGTNDATVPLDEFSIISHKEDITAQDTAYFLCDEPLQSGHTDLLFDTDGTANDELMETIEAFLAQHVK